MSHNRTRVNTEDSDISGDITVNTDNIPETGTNEYYTSARIDTKIAASNINLFADVNTAGAIDGQVLKRTAGVYVPASASGGAEVSFIGSGATIAYPWTGAIASGNEPYSNGKQIECYGLNLGTGLTTIKYEVRNAGTSDGTSAWTVTDAASYVTAGWIRSISYFPAGVYLVGCGVGLVLPASTSYLDYRVFVDNAPHGSVSRIGGDTGYPRASYCIVDFASAPVAATDNKIDIRVDASSNDLITQANAQAERGYIYIMQVA